MLINEKLSEKDRNWGFFRSSIQNSIGEDVEIVMGELVSLTFECSDYDSKVYDRARGWSLSDFDLVVFRIIREELARASASASYLIANNIPYIDTQVQPRGRSKYAAAVLRQAAGLSAIPTVHGSRTTLIEMVESGELPFGYPLVIKDNNGKKGRFNFIAHTKERALEILHRDKEIDFIIQAFIPNKGDYRVLVFGDQPVLVMYRQAQGDSHLNNTSQGATAEMLPLESVDPAILEIAKTAARTEDIEVAGVDVMKNDETGEYFVVEVNSSPQLASGAYPELKSAAYATYLKSLL